MNMINLKYRARYYWRKFVVYFGFCPDCGANLNYTSTGRPICPDCGKAK